MSQKEKTLDELIRDRWLSYTATGKIGLGTRSFLDLRSWFRGNDIPSCVVCNEACIKVLIRDDSTGFQLPCIASVVVVV
jgi:non-structural maintenance of chromosomes element 1